MRGYHRGYSRGWNGVRSELAERLLDLERVHTNMQESQTTRFARWTHIETANQ